MTRRETTLLEDVLAWLFLDSKLAFGATALTLVGFGGVALFHHIRRLKKPSAIQLDAFTEMGTKLFTELTPDERDAMLAQLQELNAQLKEKKP